MSWSHNKLVLADVRGSDPQKLYSALVWEQRNRGFKRGWVWYKYQELKGEKPPVWLSAVGVEPPDSKIREALTILGNRQWQKKKREMKKSTTDFTAAPAGSA